MNTMKAIPSPPLAAMPRASATLARRHRGRSARSKARPVSAATISSDDAADDAFFFPISSKKPISASRPLSPTHLRAPTRPLSLRRHRDLACASAAADATAATEQEEEEEEEEEEEASASSASALIDGTDAIDRARIDSSTSASTSSAPDDLASASSPLNSAFLLAATKKQWKKLLFAGVCLVFCTACNLASPVLAGRIFDSLISEAAASVASSTKAATAAAASSLSSSSSSAFLPSLAVLAFTYTAEPLVTRLYISSAVAASEEILSSARVELFRCLLAKKVSFFDAAPPAPLARAAADDLDALRAVALASTARDRGPRAALEAAGAVAVLAWLSWRLGPVLALVIGATAAAAALHRLRTKPLERAAALAAEEMHGVAARALGSMQTVRSFGAERGELLRFARAAAASSAAAKGFGEAKGQLEAMSRGAVHASLLLLYGLGGHLVRRGLMPAGVLLSAVGFTYSLVYATQGFVQTLADLRRARAALERVRAAASGERLGLLPGGGGGGGGGDRGGGEEGGGEAGEYRIDWRSLSAPDPAVLATLPSSDECLRLANNALSSSTDASRSDERKSSTSTLSTATTTTTTSPPPPPPPVADIKFDDVSFSYPTRPSVQVLRGLSLDLPAGSVTALVGPSGAGKSTVAALLSRFYEPCSGSITFGGRPIADVPFEEWTRTVSLVPQDIALFDGTIEENISFGSGFEGGDGGGGGGKGGSSSSSSSSSQHAAAVAAAVVAAAKAARAHEFIEALPQGYKTRVGGGGGSGAGSTSATATTLSGGQRQRIALARAWFKNSPVVVLDEHTSSLDGPAALQASAEAYGALVRGRRKSVLVIAHRLATVQAADRIAVVEAGRVVELGTHAELARIEGGAYARLVEASTILG